MPTYGKTMILGPYRLWNVVHWRDADSALDNGLEVTLPAYHLVVNPGERTPTTYTIGPFAINTELRIQLVGVDTSIIGVRTNLSAAARFRDGYEDGVEWFIDWEDYFDNDYNDSFTHIYADPTSLVIPGVHAAPFTFQYSNDPVHAIAA